MSTARPGGLHHRRADARPNRAFTAAPARFPTPEKIFLKTVNETQLVYAKPFRIVEDLHADGSDRDGLSTRREGQPSIPGV